MISFNKVAAMLLLSVVTVVVTVPAHAKKAPQQRPIVDVGAIPTYPTAQTRATVGAPPTNAITTDANGNGTVIGGRPAGCPHRYCGCSASLYVFGEIRPELNLAANWRYRFEHASPASGMVAARSGHIMVLMSHVGGNDWLVHDGNSGGGKTREHVRSIAGYTVVNPRQAVASVPRAHRNTRHVRNKHARYARL